MKKTTKHLSSPYLHRYLFDKTLKMRRQRFGTRDEKSMSLPVSKSVPFRQEIQNALKRRSKLSMLQVLKVMEENKDLKAQKQTMRADFTALRESRALYKSKVKDLEKEVNNLREMLTRQASKVETIPDVDVKEKIESFPVPTTFEANDARNSNAMAISITEDQSFTTISSSCIVNSSSLNFISSSTLTSSSTSDKDTMNKNIFKGEIFKGIKSGVANLFRRMSKTSQDSVVSSKGRRGRKASKDFAIKPLIPCGNYTFISIFDRRCRHCKHLKKYCDAAANRSKLKGIVEGVDGEEKLLENEVESDEEEGEAKISVRKLQACLQTPEGLRALRRKLDDQQRRIQELELAGATRDLMVQNTDSVVNSLETKMKQTLKDYEKKCSEFLELETKIKDKDAMLHSKTLENIKVSKKLSQLQNEFNVVKGVLKVKEEHLKTNDIGANKTIEALQKIHNQSLKQCKERLTKIIDENRSTWKETEISLKSKCATLTAKLAQAKLTLKHMTKKSSKERRMKQLSECHIMQLEDRYSRNYELEILQEKLKALLELCEDSDEYDENTNYDLLSALPDADGSQLIENVLRSIASPNAWAATPSAQPIRKLIAEQLDNVMKAVDPKSQPEWVPDSEAQNCSNCLIEFSTLRRRHHCRHCGNCFCHQCSDKTFLLDQYEREERVCDGCFYTLSRIHPNRKDKVKKFALTENEASRDSKLNLLYTSQLNTSNILGGNEKEMVRVTSTPRETSNNAYEFYEFQ